MKPEFANAYIDFYPNVGDEIEAFGDRWRVQSIGKPKYKKSMWRLGEGKTVYPVLLLKIKK